MIRLALASVVLAAPAFSQNLSILVTEGDTVPGVGNITRVDGVAIAGDGTTLIEVDTDNADLNADTVLLRDGVLYLREGQGLPLPSGALLDSFDGTSVRPGGVTAFNFFLDGTSGINDDSGLYLGDRLVLQEGTVSQAAAFSPGTNYIGFFDVELATDTTFLCVASIDDPNIASTVDRALVIIEVDALGNLVGETVVAKEGDVLPGQTEAIADFETGAEESAINRMGRVIYTADLAGPTATDRAIYLDQTLLAQEGSPSPVPGRSWGSLTSVEVDLNDRGDWVFKGNLDASDPSTAEVIVKNGAIFRREGDTLPAIAPFQLTDFGGSVGVWVTDTGDVLWFGDWDDPDTSRDEGLFFNDQLVLQEGVTQIGGQTIVDLSDITEQIAASEDGSRLLVEGAIDGGGTLLDVVIEIVLDLGTNYCPNNRNSTGQFSVLRATGSSVVADNAMTLEMSGMPLNAFGFFITSRTPGTPPGPTPGPEGNLCIMGQIGRYVGPGQIQNSGATGAISLLLDLTQHPTPTGLISVQAGETWYFQAWHRDTFMGQPSSIFSDATGVTFR